MINFKTLVLLIFMVPLAYIVPLHAQEGEEHPTSLSAFKPVYFLIGNPYAKIEVSFKAQMVEDLPVYFGYSQLMMWDMIIEDPYFYDVNYNPMVWYRWTFNKERKQWLDLIPEEHESNGKGGLLERSWDRAGIANHQLNKLGDHSKLLSNVKAWIPTRLNRGSTDPASPNPGNTDLSQYRGLYEFTFTLADFMGSQFDFDDLTLRFYPGGPSSLDPTRGGQELTFRVKPLHSNVLPMFVLQFFHGYAEDLLDYQKNHWEFRAGFGF